MLARRVDDGSRPRTPQYMKTRQEDPDAADAADATGTGRDEDIGDPSSDHGASERGAGAAAKVRAWFTERIPGDWFPAAADIQVDREEITSATAG
jgi:hypothetical protein